MILDAGGSVADEYIDQKAGDHAIQVGKVGRDLTIYNLKIRWLWIVGGILLLGLIYLAQLYLPDFYHWYRYRAADNELLILVADFEDNSTKDYDAADAIEESLRQAMAAYDIPNVKLVRLDRTFKRAEFEAVKSLGESYKATLFIWGHYDDAGMYPRFTVLKKEKLEISPEQPTERWDNLAAPPANFSQYVNHDLPVQMTYLTQFTLGQIFHLNKDYPQALSLFEGAVESASSLANENELPPQNLAAVHLYTGYIHLTENDLDQAFADYTEAIRLDPANADAFNNRGVVHANRGELREAMADYTQAIEIDPVHTQAYYNRALAHSRLLEFGEAIADFSQAIELGRTEAQVYLDRGNAYYDASNFKAARDDFTQAITLDQTNEYAYRNRGLTYHSLGEFEKAIADFKQAIALNPDFAAAYNSFCWTSTLLKKSTTAVIDACDQAVRLAPEEGVFRDSRGLARALAGDVRGAIEDFKFYVATLKQTDQYERYGPKREIWITELEAGRNPFDRETLQELAAEN